MNLSLTITPHGRPMLEEIAGEEAGGLPHARAAALREAFDAGPAMGLLLLVSDELTTILPPSLGFARDFAGTYLTRLCRTPELEENTEISPPPTEELGF